MDNNENYMEMVSLKKCSDILDKYKESKNIMICETTNEGKSISYRDFYAKVCQLSRQIKIKGKNIGLIGYPCIDTLAGLFAIWKSDNVAVILSPTTNTTEIKNIVKNCDIEYMFRLKLLFFEKIEPYRRELSLVNMYCDDAREKLGHRVSKEDDIALMIPTTGTTSSPKIVCLSHKSIVCHAAYNFQVFSLVNGVHEMIIGPLSAVTVICGMVFPTFFIEGTLVLYNEAFNPKKFVNCVLKYNVNYTGLTPSLLKQFLILKNEDLKILGKVAGICLGGEPISPSLVEQFVNAVPEINLIPMYGLTETGGAISGWQDDINLRNYSVGRLYPGIEVKIVKNNSSLKDDYGEIYLHNLPLFNGYYKNPEETSKVICNGWLKTGDIGYVDADNYLYIQGRIKNIIIVGGNNVLAEEIEECLMAHPNVQYAFVYSQKDNIYGETPIAEVVLKERMYDMESLLKKWCSDKMENYKIPKKIIEKRSIELIGIGKKGRN